MRALTLFTGNMSEQNKLSLCDNVSGERHMLLPSVGILELMMQNYEIYFRESNFSN